MENETYNLEVQLKILYEKSINEENDFIKEYNFHFREGLENQYENKAKELK